jgi:hypothetical protein
MWIPTEVEMINDSLIISLAEISKDFLEIRIFATYRDFKCERMERLSVMDFYGYGYLLAE